MNPLEVKFDFEPCAEHFLSDMILSFRSMRPNVDPSLTFTAFMSGTMLQIWINTPACRFSLLGKCSICDYWDGVLTEQAVIDVCDYIEKNGSLYETLLLNTCGSCFSEEELPFSVFQKIVHSVSKTTVKRVIFETHLAYVTVEKIMIVKNMLSGKEMYIEYGQETTSPYVLKFCLNKPSMLEDYDIINKLHNMGVYVIANVVLGAPFLSVEQRIMDSIHSIHDLLEKGIDGIVLFPVNIKPYTMIKYLHDSGYYKRVNAAEILKVLDKFEPENLSRISLAWFEPEREKQEAYNEMGMGPQYCDSCGENLLNHLLDYVQTDDGAERRRIISEAIAENCGCIDLIYDYPFPDFRESYKFLKTEYKRRKICSL